MLGMTRWHTSSDRLRATLDGVHSGRVFVPLGMNTTAPTNVRPKPSAMATGYAGTDNAGGPAPEWIALRPSGAFISSVLDLGKMGRRARRQYHPERGITPARCGRESPQRQRDRSLRIRGRAYR